MMMVFVFSLLSCRRLRVRVDQRRGTGWLNDSLVSFFESGFVEFMVCWRKREKEKKGEGGWMEYDMTDYL